MDKIKLILVGVVSSILLINGVSSLSIQNTKINDINNHETPSLFQSISPNNYLPKDVVNKQINEKPEFVQGEFIVKFKSEVKLRVTKSRKGISSVGISSIDRLNELHNVYSVEKVFNDRITSDGSHDLSYFYKFTFSKNKNVLSIVEEYKRDINVAYAGPNYIMKAYLNPNDPYYFSSGSWGQDFEDLYGLRIINSSGAWDITTGSHEVVVAVVDTGADYNHDDLADNMWINVDEIPGNEIDDDEDGFIDNIYGADIINNDGDPMDGHGHGTHCAGTIAAVGNNSFGVVGVNWQTKIMAIKGLGDGGSGGSETLAQALCWAADNGADVISNSWGSQLRNPSNPVIEAAIQYIYGAGCVVVFAAGNNNDDVQYYSPQNMVETIVVAATDYLDGKAWFTNWGELVDICAPGVDILSLRANGTDMYGDEVHIVDEKYYYASGTSMACPHVAGLAALMLSKNQSLSQDMMKTVLLNTVDEVYSPDYIGVGRINASEALHREPAIALLDTFSRDSDVNGSVNITGTAWGELFQYFVVEYGKERSPDIWIEITNSSLYIVEDVLTMIDTTSLDDGYYSIRLQLFCQDGVYEDIIGLVINNGYNTFYVDDDNIEGPWNGTVDYPYQHMYDAVDSAGNGDEVFVCNGSYHEHLQIDRSITLTGENASYTMVSGIGNYSEAILVLGDNMFINGFSVIDSDGGITLHYSSNNTVTGNHINNNRNGVILTGASFNHILQNNIFGNTNYGVGLGLWSQSNTISENVLTDNKVGVYLYYYSSNNTVIQNQLSDHYYNGMVLSENCEYNTIALNEIANSTNIGISIGQSSYNSFFRNTIFNNGQSGTGIQLHSSTNNTIFENTITDCFNGVFSYAYCSNNSFYHNNFFNNKYNAWDLDLHMNLWDNGYPDGGNYWDDYTGIDADGDGVGDTSYIVPNGNQDRYPFMNQDGWVLPNWWPMFHHDLRHTGYSTSNAPETNSISWIYETGHLVRSSPAVVNHKVYVGSDKFYCLDASSGDIVWNYTTSDYVMSSPAVADGKVYFGSYDENVYCLNAADGTKEWEFLTDNRIISSPTVVADMIYIGSDDGYVYALPAADPDANGIINASEVCWSYETDGPVESSPSVVNGCLYIGSNDGNVYCLYASNGTIKWMFPTGTDVRSSPAVVNGYVYVGSDDGNMYCLDASDGQEIWRYSTSVGLATSSPAVVNGNIFFGTFAYDGKVFCLNATDGSLIWEYQTSCKVETSPAVVNGKVYLGLNWNEVCCLNASDGSEIWNYSTEGLMMSSPAVANGNLYIGSDDGKIYAFGDLVLKAKAMFRKIK